MPPWLTLHGLWFRCRLVTVRFWRRPLVGLLPLLLFFGSGVLAAYLVVSWTLTPDATEPGMPHPVFAQAADDVHHALSRLTGNTAIEALLGGEWSKFARESIGGFGEEPSKIVPLVIAGIALGAIFMLVFHFCRPFPASPGALTPTATCRWRRPSRR